MKRARVLLCLLLACASQAFAQDYPSRPVRIIVPYSAGGVPDVLGRTVGQRMSENLGQQFLVENRPGAGGISAVMSVVKAQPDGHTLLLSDPGQTAINQYLFKTLPYDTLRDLAPAAILAYSAPYLAASPSAGISTFNELVAHARANPGRLSYGSAGIGSSLHIAIEAIKAALSLDIVHVPYKGSGQSVPAFLAGETPLVVTALTALGPHVKAGKAKLLVVTSAKRSALAPDVPSAAEFIPGYDFTQELGFLAPAGTPAAVIAKIAAETAKAVKHPDVNARLTQLGLEPSGGSPEEFVATIRRNQERYATVVKLSGAKAE